MYIFDKYNFELIFGFERKFKKEINIDFDSNIVKYTPSNYSDFRLGYAISIHKAQGSEFDSVIFYTTMTLVFIGIIMVFSASYVQSSFKHHDAYYFLKRNVIYAILGFISMMFISNIDYRIYKRFDKLIYITVIVLLAAVAVIGKEVGRSKTLDKFRIYEFSTIRNC